MFTPSRLILAAALAALVTGCASNNPYDNQTASAPAEGMSKTAKYGGLGALAGAVAGAAINHDNRGKGALIGAGIGGLNVAMILVFLLATAASAWGLLRVFLTDPASLGRPPWGDGSRVDTPRSCPRSSGGRAPSSRARSSWPEPPP